MLESGAENIGLCEPGRWDIFQLPGLCDSYLAGRFGHIIEASLKKARPLLTAHFDLLNTHDIVLAETKYFEVPA